MGCKHYRRKVKLEANCCKTIFPCRFCHDEACDHGIVRHETKNMLCMLCMTLQPAAKTCCKCGVDVAAYYCDKCKLWDDDPKKSIYHCDDCGICRQGKGLNDDYFHCKKCNICMVMGMKGKHRCIERNLESDCPICGEYMFTSTTTVVFMVKYLEEMYFTYISRNYYEREIELIIYFVFIDSNVVIVFTSYVIQLIYKHHTNVQPVSSHWATCQNILHVLIENLYDNPCLQNMRNMYRTSFVMIVKRNPVQNIISFIINVPIAEVTIPLYLKQKIQKRQHKMMNQETHLLPLLQHVQHNQVRHHKQMRLVHQTVQQQRML